jgi:pyrroline-5-carboxylate reductase
MYGTIKLMLEKKMSFDALIERAGMKVGITEDGVKILRK